MNASYSVLNNHFFRYYCHPLTFISLMAETQIYDGAIVAQTAKVGGGFQSAFHLHY